MHLPVWFQQKGYAQGVFWIIMVALISNTNDILMRFLGSHLPALEVTFFRYFFATLTLLPFMLKGKQAFYTKRPGIHALRALLLFGAMGCWVKGVSMVHLVVASTMALTTNLFVLPMAVIFLKEKVGWQRTLATLLGFLGVFIVVGSTSLSTLIQDFTTNNGALYLMGGAVMFALSDILNKKFVSTESTLSMLFYVALGTALVGFVPAFYVWQTPTYHELLLLLLLGTGGNLILFFLLKAFAATDVSALAPYRYTELLTAGLLGFVLFNEVPTLSMLMGASIIVPCTFWIATVETRKSKTLIKPVSVLVD